MRDAGRIKEKITLTLDSRQVVSLVLGSAVVLGIVFYLGVTVGKDLAASRIAAVPADPLERLDKQAATDVRHELTFPETLTGEPGGQPVPAEAVAKADDSAKADDAAKAEKTAADVLARADAEAKAEAEKAASEKAAAEKAEAEKRAAAEKAAAEKLAAEKTAAEKAAQARAATGPSGNFTVQVAAMPSRPEAEAFVSQLRSKGFAPYVVEADVPGKGTYYRIRLGKFRTRDDATRYLQDFKRETSLQGFVASVDG